MASRDFQQRPSKSRFNVMSTKMFPPARSVWFPKRRLSFSAAAVRSFPLQEVAASVLCTSTRSPPASGR
eukprot:scaffold8165_cov116-Isochrysis_galbana.AAC.3